MTSAETRVPAPFPAAALQTSRGKRSHRIPVEAGWPIPFDPPASWTKSNTDQVAKAVEYGTSTKTMVGEFGIPVIRMGNIQNGRIVLDKIKTLPIGHPEFPKLLLLDGDVLFNRTNSAELVGKTAVFRGSNPTSFASYLIRIQLGQDCLPEWLSTYLNSSFGRQWISRVSSQQVGQANVNGEKLRSLVIPLPSFEEQQAVLAELDHRLSIAEALESTAQTSLARAERLRQSILERAFRGELVPQDPNDEPAEALLARIKKTHQTNEGQKVPSQRGYGRKPKATVGGAP